MQCWGSVTFWCGCGSGFGFRIQLRIRLLSSETLRMQKNLFFPHLFFLLIYPQS
jgi:hypothetical protein